MSVFFGDLHAHASVSPCYWKDCPYCAPDDFFRYARTVSGLDFVALTDHDHALDDETWGAVQDGVRRHYDPGQFVTFLGYEWTNNRYGHQNVYFPGDAGPLIRARGEGGQFITPEDLWRRWKADGVRAISIPHHVGVSQFPIDWTFYDPVFQPVTEVTSLWGNFLKYHSPSQTRISNLLPGRFVSEALEDGYRLGFVGGSDSHDCRPGNPTFGGRIKPNAVAGKPMGHNPLAPPNVTHLGDDTCNTRGLTAVWASALTREALWDAIRRGHTYATTGARIYIRAGIGDAVPGDAVGSLAAGLTVDVIGTHLLADVSVVFNNDTVYRVAPDSDRVQFTWDLPPCEAGGFLYLRVRQRDGHQAWTSPMWIPPAQPRPATRQTTAPPAFETTSVEDGSGAARMLEDGPVALVRVTEVGTDPVIITLSMEGDAWPSDVSGSLQIQNASRIRVRDRNLVTAKYGGDLYTLAPDHTQVAFHFPRTTERGAPPQLDLLIRRSSTEQCTVQMDLQGISAIRVGEGSGLTSGIQIRLAPVTEAHPASELLPWPDRVPS